jgi:uncharacterized iron-regulated membrane protein
MFDTIKNNIKLALLGALAVIVVIVAGVIYFQHNKIEKISNENAGLNTAVDTAATTAKQDAQTAANTDKVVADSVQDTKQVGDSISAIEQGREDKKADVQKKYDNLPKPATPSEQAAQDKAKADETSRVQIHSIWQAYCVAAPDDPKCAPKVITASAVPAQ